MIRLEGVSFSYGDTTALRDIDLSIQGGAAVALIGPNGSGKSTLMKILTGLEAIDQGIYFFNGQLVNPKSLADRSFAKYLHRRIGFLFQNSEAQLFCPTVAEELAFGPLQLGLDEGAVEERVHDCAALLGIEPLREKPPYQLSEGEKRKVALAAVLSLNPEVLVLDEPLNSLDPRTKRFLRSLLEGLHRSGKTIVASTHDFNYLEDLFTTAVVLSQDHRVLRIGPYDEIIADRAFLEAHNIV
jgi:cobalt/nickel transport system ATP-binding protein